MYVQPTATVTFLFTDIEGSTRLWEQDSRVALARYDEVLRSAIALGVVKRSWKDKRAVVQAVEEGRPFTASQPRILRASSGCSLRAPGSPASVTTRRIFSLSVSGMRRSGGRTWASSSLPKMARASFILLCPSRNGSA